MKTDQQLVDEARRASVCVYIAMEESVAEDLSRILKGLADRIVELSPSIQEAASSGQGSFSAD